MSIRHILAAALAAGTLLAWLLDGKAPSPTPAPPAPGTLDLSGKAVGPTAADDLVTLGALCGELASCLEYDGSQSEPRIKTGVALEDLRVAAREARLKGDSIGARQPHLRDAVGKYLDEHAGNDGGPLTPEERSAWVAAFRDVARACDAAR